MDIDNTQDTAEPSPASAGSHGAAVAWAVRYGLDPDPEVYWHYPRHAAESGRIIVPLYRQPTLSDEEFVAMQWAVDTLCVGWDDLKPDDKDRSRKAADTLRRMVARLS